MANDDIDDQRQRQQDVGRTGDHRECERETGKPDPRRLLSAPHQAVHRRRKRKLTRPMLPEGLAADAEGAGAQPVHHSDEQCRPRAGEPTGNQMHDRHRQCGDHRRSKLLQLLEEGAIEGDRAERRRQVERHGQESCANRV